jgi:hypothetical protein
MPDLTSTTPQDAVTIARELLDEHRGSAEKALAKEIRLRLTAESERDRYKALAETAPKDGGRVLTKDEASAYDALTALGTAAEIKAKLDRSATLDTENADLRRGQQAIDVADAYGWNLKATRRLLKDEGLELVEVKTETVDGKDVTAALVRKAGDEKAAPVKLHEHVTQHASEMEPALQARTTPATPATPPTRTTSYPEQRAGGGKPKPDIDRIAEQQRQSGTFAI